MSQTILGFDYGQRRIGVAIGQSITHTTRPLTTVMVAQQRPDWEQISRLLEEWQPDLVVVGLPMNMDGTEHEMSKRARRFANQINGRYQLTVELVDERLSSIEAEEIVQEARREGRLKRKNSKQSIDQVAAELIIQTWWSEHHKEHL